METITGFVDHIVFQNSENGYTVMILSTEGEEMTCVGMCKGLTQGENISAEGEYIEHPYMADSSNPELRDRNTDRPRGNGTVSGLRSNPGSR